MARQRQAITIMQMDEGMDTGDILLQEKLPVEPGGHGRKSWQPKLAKLGGESPWGSTRSAPGKQAENRPNRTIVRQALPRF